MGQSLLSTSLVSELLFNEIPNVLTVALQSLGAIAKALPQTPKPLCTDASYHHVF